jgi:hypothetical protein
VRRAAATAAATAAALAALLWAAPATAQVLFPTRSGESGILDVPDAEVLPRYLALLGAELGVTGATGARTDVGPMPIYAAGGFTPWLESGLTLRQGGQPGDPRPARMLFGGAAKLQFFKPHERVPGFALDATIDRVGAGPVLGSRLISSIRWPEGALRLSGYVGVESEVSGKNTGVTWGGALAAGVGRNADLVLEGFGGPRGESVGGAIRWRATATTCISLGYNYLLKEEGYRVSLGFGFGPQPTRREPEPTAAAPEEAPSPLPQAAVAFAEDRPRFRLKLHAPDPVSGEPRSLRHGPWLATGPGAATRPGAPGAAPPLRSAAPSLEDLAEAQLREQEGLVETRDRRVHAAAEQLDAREKTLADETRRLADRERDLAAREQQLDARERRVGRPGAPPQPERDLEAQEAQLATQERNLAAQERSFGPAVDAAQGRERDAAAREDTERFEANRLTASVSGAGSRAQQLEVRKQALGARNRQLSAGEARLVARGERVDAQERQTRARGERLDAWQRRLDVRGERLDLIENRGAEPKGAGGAPAKGAGAAAAAAGSKDKAIFVMVVKAPTAIVKERAAAGAAAAAPAVAGAVPTGSAVEKAVAAATVVAFPTPAAQLSELDRETIDNIAKLAAKEQCELLIWARAKDPSLMAEAQRRAAEIKTRVLSVAPLSERQIQTRITTRPGAQGVDVVVSALRDTRPAAPAVPAAPVPAGRPQLAAGEAGKRQVREAIQAAQPSIEACVGELMEQKRLGRAEGTLKVTISSAGKVVKVLAADGDLVGASVTECLTSASGAWTFPGSDAEYVVDVPITVIRGGAPR